MTTLEVLKAARELISVPERWTKGAFARDLDGDACTSLNPEACCWCSIGAINKVSMLSPDSGNSALDKIKNVVGSVPYFNDAPERTHSEILEVFDKAIADLTAQEQPPCSA